MLRKLIELLKPEKPVKLLILGLDQAGKTSFLQRLKLDQFTNPSRTMGLNMDRVSVEGLKLDVLDLGGQKAFRSILWPRMFEEEHPADIILFVVDSADKLRIIEMEEEFEKLVSAAPAQIPIGVLANKQDLPEALQSGEIAVCLQLVGSIRTFAIFSTSMLTGEGVNDVLKWIKDVISKQRR
ncbi:MAG: ADP-ribosylation factor-like protein [Candidatus Hodarchaeota archaeon]